MKHSVTVEYNCNSNHRYGKQYCTPHTVRESHLDELIKDEVRSLRETIISESKRYDRTVERLDTKKAAV